MRILVVGAGAVGGFFGARLAAAGEEVSFVARGATREALLADGLRVESPAGNLRVRPAAVSDDPAELPAAKLVLVCVKAWQVPAVARRLRPAMGPDGCVLPLQNGVEASAQLAAELGPAPVLGGLCKIIALQSAPGRIRHVGVDPYVALGEIGRPPTARVRRIRATLETAGITVDTPDDIEAAVWEKFLFICAVSGVGAVTGSPIGEIRGDPGSRRMLELAMREIGEVARGHGITLAPDAVERTLAFIDGLPPEGTASMQRDIAAGRPSELESQTGAVVRLGQAAGVATPVNREIYDRLLPLERRSRAGPRS